MSAPHPPTPAATLGPMRILHETRAVLAAHWRDRHGNVWAWILPLSVLACALPPR